EIHARVERAIGPAEQPSLPVGIALADGRDVLVLRHVPARPVVVPALADRNHLAQLPASDHLPHALLIRTTEPLRSHLHDASAANHHSPPHPPALARSLTL